jgi:hypothetical protein
MAAAGSLKALLQVLSGSYRARSAFPVAAVYDRRKLPPAFTGNRLKKSLLTTKFLNK